METTGDTTEHIIRNQIEYIAINQRFNNAKTSVQACPGADMSSHQNILPAKDKKNSGVTIEW